MDRSIAEEIVPWHHEAIDIRRNDSYDDADDQKGKSTAIPPQEIQSRVQDMAASCVAYTASVRVQELP